MKLRDALRFSLSFVLLLCLPAMIAECLFLAVIPNQLLGNVLFVALVLTGLVLVIKNKGLRKER